jgi:hypothetical protein
MLISGNQDICEHPERLGVVCRGCANVSSSNHNMDPNIVNSASFGLQWKVPFNTNEQVSMIFCFQEFIEA